MRALPPSSWGLALILLRVDHLGVLGLLRDLHLLHLIGAAANGCHDCMPPKGRCGFSRVVAKSWLQKTIIWHAATRLVSINPWRCKKRARIEPFAKEQRDNRPMRPILTTAVKTVKAAFSRRLVCGTIITFYGSKETTKKLPRSRFFSSVLQYLW